MQYSYTPHGVCSRNITFDIEDGVVRNVRFTGGCSGNTQGVARLAEGRAPEELISILSGINCGMKGTSCPDQLSLALKQAING